MIECTLNSKEFAAKPISGNYGINNLFICQLAEFFSTHLPGQYYYLNFEEEIPSNLLFSESLSQYKHYGIYVNGVRTVEPITEYLLVLTKEDLTSRSSLRRKIQEKSVVVPNGQFSSCVIMQDFVGEDPISCAKVVSMLQQEQPFIKIWNSGLECEEEPEISVNSADEQWHLVDLSEVMNKYTVRGVDYNKNFAAAKMMLREIKSFKGLREDTVFYFETTESTLEYLYVGIAAYLTITERLRFRIPPQKKSYYLQCMRNYTSRSFNHLKDYMDFVVNPLQVGVFFRGKSAYLCLLDLTKYAPGGVKNNSMYGVRFNVCQTAFDLETEEFADESVTVHTYDYNMIQALSIPEIFNLNTGDFESDIANLNRLNLLIAHFEAILSKKYPLGEEALNCTNLLLYKFRGRAYFGYVSYIEGKMPYNVLPLSNKYKSFKHELTLQAYNQLYDVSIFFDYQDLLRMLTAQKLITGQNAHYEIHSHCIGSLITCLPVATKLFNSDCDFSIDEIGIWSVQSNQCRQGAEANLLKYISAKVLRQKNFLTYYGGCHPSYTVQLLLEADSWK